MVRSIAKSTYFKELLFPYFKIFYTLIVHYDNDDYVINFVFSIGKQPYRDVINFLSYIHVYSGVVGRERMGTAFPRNKLSGNGVPTREILRDIFLLLPLN